MKRIQSKMKHCNQCPSQSNGIFCELEKVALDDLSLAKVTNTFNKGQTLFVEGCPPYGLYCISKGNIKVTKLGQNGKSTIIRIAKGGDVLGHRSLFTEKYYSATATAMEKTTVCFIDKDYILRMINAHPSVAYNLITKLSEGLGLSENKVSSFNQKNVFERLAEVLLLLNQSHGQQMLDGNILININLTREELASMVGTATETIIRFISELREDHIISQDGKKIILINEEELLRIANPEY